MTPVVERNLERELQSHLQTIPKSSDINLAVVPTTQTNVLI
jgi:hypothetical protein